ncbi:hypothetical protein [Streptomyces smyrnaeus]|uniref:hypothetical protein n=1 Tax=Streptomyces smyrnaeus TaxID=1387713 RepID=UPI0033C7FAD5
MILVLITISYGGKGKRVRFWVFFRLLVAIGTISIMMMWGQRRGELLRGIDRDGFAVFTELSMGLAIPLVLFAALLSIPFEIFVLRRRRSWHLGASIVVLGVNAVLAIGSATVAPEATLLPEEAAAYSTDGRVLFATVLFLVFYYILWAPTIYLVATVAFFAGGKRATYERIDSTTVQVALDAGPTLAQLGLVLTAAGITQAYDRDEGWQQMIVPVGVGVALLVLTLLTLAGYRRTRS